MKHSKQGLCAYTGKPRNKSGNNADTSLTFITGPFVRSAEEIFATRREMVPHTFAFPIPSCRFFLVDVFQVLNAVDGAKETGEEV